MANSTKITTDHDTIKSWTEARNGRPAMVESTENKDGKGGLIRLQFSDDSDSLDPVEWDAFFEAFDNNELAMIYQEETSEGKQSTFNKFIDRNGEQAKDLMN